jgi:hypothetical protein
MAGWSRKKRVAFEGAFYDFLDHCYINSKDLGRVALGAHLYDAQRRFFTGIFDGLEEDIHTFDALKSRQLGISTSVRALSVFWLGMHDGLGGACVFDTDFNKNNARQEIVTMIRDLPPEVAFPRIKINHRGALTLENDSTLAFLSAGVKQSKSSGTLGRSLGLSMYHASELCSYDNPEGWEAFEQSKSDENPNRLYLRESTARGFNSWHEIWSEDRKDTAHVRCIFLGWWSKNSQRIPRAHPDFERYGMMPPTDRELARIQEVKDQYGHRITPEQLAWVRRKMDPTAKPEGDAPPDYEGSVVRLQEQPWTEEDAFQMTGSVFFPPEQLTEMVTKHVSRSFKTYMYSAGIEFTDMKVFPAPNARTIELKVWEEPEETAVYVVAVDPAFGENEHNDRSAIQVLKCFADGCDQVAEYAWPLINTRQFAWVVASLLGWYAGDAATVYLILELNGPGEAVWNELQSLRHQLASGYTPREVEERGLRTVFRNVRNYIYSRSDSLTPGYNYQWKTTQRLKVSIMERLRDFTSNGMLHIRSLDTLEEMRSVTREGDAIAAQGSKKDDRVFALALGVRCWEERVRKSMMTMKTTRENWTARKAVTVKDQAQLYNTHMLDSFFAVKRVARVRDNRDLNRRVWRGRR